MPRRFLPEREKIPAGCRVVSSFWSLPASDPVDSLSRIKYILVGLTFVLCLGTAGYAFLERWPLLDSLYMTVISITTVGYGEVRPLDSAGKVFTMILVLSSMGLAAYVALTISKVIIEGELRQIFWRRRMEKKIQDLKNHYIICGYGRIGKIICRNLADGGIRLVVVEKNESLKERLEGDGHMFILGDAKDEGVLVKAGVKRASGLVAVVESDADNVYITLTARSLNPSIYILARAGEELAEKNLLAAGANEVIPPYRIGALRMVNAILRPTVMEFIELATQKDHLELQLEEILVRRTDRLPSAVLRDSGIRSELGLIIVAVKKEAKKMIFNPSPELTISPGDVLVALGERGSLARLRSLVSP